MVGVSTLILVFADGLALVIVGKRVTFIAVTRVGPFCVNAVTIRTTEVLIRIAFINIETYTSLLVPGKTLVTFTSVGTHGVDAFAVGAEFWLSWFVRVQGTLVNVSTAKWISVWCDHKVFAKLFEVIAVWKRTEIAAVFF